MRKTDKSKHKHKRIYISIIILILIIMRVVYVNAAYPFAGIHILEQNEVIKIDGQEIIIRQANLFDKTNWDKYLNENNIKTDIEYYNNDNKDFVEKLKKYLDQDYNEAQLLGYENSDNMRILFLEVVVNNTKSEENSIRLDDYIKPIYEGLSNYATCNSYYTSVFNSLDVSINKPIIYKLQPGNNSVKLVYIFNSDNPEIHIDIEEYGNNQRINLDI